MRSKMLLVLMQVPLQMKQGMQVIIILVGLQQMLQAGQLQILVGKPYILLIQQVMEHRQMIL
tara:strand:+ start:68 stop:253 length:186 start_codon:yes stop_codon:yes gene_type:complete